MSGMGLTAIDLFNDIFVDENDLRMFIEDHRLLPASSANGMAIQGIITNRLEKFKWKEK